MDQSYIQIRGGRRLEGEIAVQGSKNTVLPVLAACLLSKGRSRLYHCPRIHDVFMMTGVMEHLGCQITWVGHTLTVDTTQIHSEDLPYEYTGNFRASVLLMGALMGREGYVSMGKPGGCRIGSRPIDFHLKGFQSLGAEVTEEEGRYCCYGKSLMGAKIHLPFPSVGATENLLLAAVMAEGETVIEGCAKEPEICDLAEYLIRMGAEISGVGTSCIRVSGGKSLHPADYYVPADRIVTATYLLGAMVTRGNIRLFTGRGRDRFDSIIKVLKQMGALIEMEEGSISLSMNRPIQPVHLVTGPHPQPPTDIQSMVLTAVLTACGSSRIEENIFESRYQVAEELRKMGGDIRIEGKYASVCPVNRIYGQEVEVKELRGGAALVLAGLMAEGDTRIYSLSYLKRGYENITEDFYQLGADIMEIK